MARPRLAARPGAPTDGAARRRATQPDMKITACRFHVSAARPQDFPRDGRPQIAFMGRSNVGKSSLLNRLLGTHGLARTSKEPGRTRAINFFAVNEQLYFVDLPGYGYAKVPGSVREAWKDLVEAYMGGPGRPDLALVLLDIRHAPGEMDEELRDWLRDRDVRHEIVLTKTDKVSGNDRTVALRGVANWLDLPDGRTPLAVSAATGSGIPALWRVIDDVYLNATLRATRGDGLHGRAATQGGRTIP
jgi:GTP-binding protein